MRTLLSTLQTCATTLPAIKNSVSQQAENPVRTRCCSIFLRRKFEESTLATRDTQRAGILAVTHHPRTQHQDLFPATTAARDRDAQQARMGSSPWPDGSRSSRAPQTSDLQFRRQGPRWRRKLQGTWCLCVVSPAWEQAPSTLAHWGPGLASLLIGEFMVVSMAQCSLWNSGSPSATTSSRLWQWTQRGGRSRSLTLTLSVTLIPASLHTRAACEATTPGTRARQTKSKAMCRNIWREHLPAVWTDSAGCRRDVAPLRADRSNRPSWLQILHGVIWTQSFGNLHPSASAVAHVQEAPSAPAQVGDGQKTV